MSEPSQPAGNRFLYWVIVIVLLAFGFLAIFSIGMYFVVLGLALIVLSPFRFRPSVVRPSLALVMGFIIGYALIAPWSCS